MDWNGGFRPFVSRPPESSFNFLSNYNFDQYPDMKNEAMGAEETQGLFRETGKMSNYGGVERKKRLTSDQLDSLERSFQEEIKLDPDRKIKLSQELGMQPRQIAVWFQNRRARWKAKQLERLYDALKEDYVTISKEKVKLQEEVSELKTMLIEQAGKKRPPAIFTDVSGEETVESTSVAIGGSKMQRETTTNGHCPVDCNYLYNVEDYTRVSQPPFWPPPGAFCHPILDKTNGEEAD